MASRKHSQDRDVFVIHHPENAGDALVFYSETDAFECWKHQSDWYVDMFNPVEGNSRPLTDEWLEMLVANERPEPPAPRVQHVYGYSAMRVTA